MQAGGQGLDILGCGAARGHAHKGLLAADGLWHVFVRTYMAKEHGLQVQKVAAGAVQLGKGVFGFSGGSCLIDDDEKVAHAVVEVEHLDQGVAVGEGGWFRRDDDQTYGGQGRKGLHGLGDARALSMST